MTSRGDNAAGYRAEPAGDRKRCPSSRCEPGNILLGLVGRSGEIEFFAEHIEVTPGFAAVAKQGRRPEARFRFSSLCLRNGCSKWTGDGCGVAFQALRFTAQPELATDDSDLPRCSIRSECQWFAEHGPRVCGVCRWIVTERNEAR